VSCESIEVQLPKNWVKASLEDIAEIILGQSPSSSTYNEHGEGLPFYQGKLEFGKTYPTPQKWCSEPKKVAEKGDVLISVRAPVGPTNVCPEKSCIGRGLAAIRGFGGIEPFFILQLLRSCEKVIARKGTGTTFSAISGGQLRGLEIPIPPLDEQHRIVSKVEELFSFLDAGVESLRKAQAQLKRYRQAVLKHAFEGKLTEEWRKTHKNELEPATKLLEHIKQERKKDTKHKELTPLDTSELPQLPEEWVWTTIGHLYDIVGGGTPATNVAEYWNGDVPWITSADIHGLKDVRPQRHITKQGIKNSATNLVPEGSLIVVTRVGLGKVALSRTPICFSQDSQALVGNSNLICPEYALYYLSKAVQIFKYEHRGTTIAGVTKRQLAELLFPLSPISEQHKIIEEVERRYLVADEIEKTVEQGIRQSERLRQSILKAAFEGKLVPQDPDDESADKLLERIVAERTKREAEDSVKSNSRKSKTNDQLELSRYVK